MIMVVIMFLVVVVRMVRFATVRATSPTWSICELFTMTVITVMCRATASNI